MVGRMFSTNFSLAANSEYVLAFTSGVDGAGFAITNTPLTGGTSGLTYVGENTNHYHLLTLTGDSVSSGTGSGGGTSAVPEASTSLGLLALGAGGLFTRRRLKRKA